MILFDNIIFSLQKAGGISTYWGEILERVVKDNFDYTVLERIDGRSNVVRNCLELPDNNIILSNVSNLFFDRIRNVRFSCKEKFVFHSSYFRNVIKTNNHSTVLTVHDFIPEYFYSGIKLKMHTIQKKKALLKADKIITISNSTKSDLFKFHPWIDPEKVYTIHNGVSNKFVFSPHLFDSSEKPMILFVGSRAKYKNFRNLVELIAKLKEFKLVVVGPILDSSEINFLNSSLGSNWVAYHDVSIETLNSLYSRAFALVYPSSYEGFGIPILEAMRSGCPVIALNNSSIPEVGGESCILLDCLTLDTLKNSLIKISSNRSLFIAKGLEHSLQFSWDNCYHNTLKIYNSLLV